jgi:hypothetical protein
VREAFEKWYAAYKDITLYIDGMQDAFEAGYNARSKERDAQAAPGPKCSLEEATESVSKWPAWKREYSEQHPFLTSQDRKSESTASLVLSRDNRAWLASTTPRPDLIAISEKVWGVRFDGKMVCAPTIEEAVTVLRSGLAAKEQPPAAPRFGALKAKRDYPQHWDVATCISAHLEEQGLVKIGLEGVRAQEIVRLWLAAQEKP